MKSRELMLTRVARGVTSYNISNVASFFTSLSRLTFALFRVNMVLFVAVCREGVNKYLHFFRRFRLTVEHFCRIFSDYDNGDRRVQADTLQAVPGNS